MIGAYEQNQRALRPLSILNGKYLTGRVLGEGGFGITYLGLDLNLKHKVAIKEYFPIQCASRNTAVTLNPELSVMNGSTQQIFQKGYDDFVLEARRLSALEHMPGIVHVLNFFYENNTAYMVMEHIEGVTLKDRLANGGKIRWNETLSLIQPVIDSLAVVHRHGVIHRDISPDNIMLDKEGKMTLIDFGAAREQANDGKSKTVVLKHGYAPSEQYQTHGNQGTWTDVYGICATIYRMITGERLPDAMALYTGSEQVKPLHGADRTLPSNIESIIMQGLSPRVENRIKNMEELRSYLYQGRKMRSGRKSRRGIIAVSSALTVAAAAVILLLFFMGRGGTNTIQNNSRQTAGVETSDKVPYLDTASQYVKDHGYSYTQAQFISTTQTNEGLVVTGTNYSVTDVILPEEIEGTQIVGINGIGNNVINLVLPDTLTSIDSNTFKNCVYLESIYIPASVTYIGPSAFENCVSLTDIHISEDNQYYFVENGKIVSYDGTTIN